MELIIHLQKSQFFPPLYYRYKQIPSSSSYSYLYKLAIIVMNFFLSEGYLSWMKLHKWTKKLTLEILFPQKELFLDSEEQLNMNIKCIKRRQRKAGKEGQRGGGKKIHAQTKDWKEINQIIFVVRL